MDATRLFMTIGLSYAAAWFFSLPFRLIGKRAGDVALVVLWVFFLVGLWPRW